CARGRGSYYAMDYW
nr:immunoglobulin heavy chain junction region [Mus musculus]MBK4195071.1 immunoglobulin heavy chain junction region [Mus musculus]